MPGKNIMKPMTLNVPDEYIPLMITALEHQHTRAIQREDARYLEAADWFKRKRSLKSFPTPANCRKLVHRMGKSKTPRD